MRWSSQLPVHTSSCGNTYKHNVQPSFPPVLFYCSCELPHVGRLWWGYSPNTPCGACSNNMPTLASATYFATGLGFTDVFARFCIDFVARLVADSLVPGFTISIPIIILWIFEIRILAHVICNYFCRWTPLQTYTTLQNMISNNEIPDGKCFVCLLLDAFPFLARRIELLLQDVLLHIVSLCFQEICWVHRMAGIKSSISTIPLP